MKKQSKRERAAEKYVKTERTPALRALTEFNAFLAGAAWQKRQDVAAVKALPTTSGPRDYYPIESSEFQDQALAAIRKTGK